MKPILTSPRDGLVDAADSRDRAFAGLFGLLLGLGLLKFGNPVILDHLVETPGSFAEWRAFAWPVWIGQVALLFLAILGFLTVRSGFKPSVPAWVMAALGTWFAWQFVAAVASVDPPLTRSILLQFAACVVCFLLGNRLLASIPDPRVFWLCLTAAFLGIVGVAAQQHFGGLEDTRKMIFETNRAADLAPEYLARIQSDRVFSTLVYPNALAGAILLVLPLATVSAWRFGARRGKRLAQVLAVAMTVAGLAVMMWSGSKAGWLLTLALVVFLLFQSPLSRTIRILMAVFVILSGLGGFAYVFAEKLSRGATSVSARMDYWTAAVKGFQERPLLGQGPGGFKKVYTRLKRPESEMAQLAHNDYLQQATDSGMVGFGAYLVFVIGSMVFLYFRIWRPGIPIMHRAVWLGLAGWFAQGGFEFGLYIPATAWLAYALLGWLLGQRLSTEPS